MTRIAQPDVGWIPNVAPPIRMSATPLRDPTPAPRLGQHTDEVLARILNLSENRIRTLHQSQAI
ncbi:hypothetical protein SDC9_158379 [bioreactor metagenome]|uniref:Formyl-CoA transferase n=1 Tax=bioreactor metagenome TaxID=1076179 RepID=A0A645F9M7_9ZZZZ